VQLLPIIYSVILLLTVCYAGGMSDKVDLQLVLKRVEDVLAAQEALAAKVGTVATSMVSMMKRIDDLDNRMIVFSQRQQESTNTIHLVAVAVDEHTHQLGAIKTRLDGIEKKLGLAHA
jgi:hypothetical protein